MTGDVEATDVIKYEVFVGAVSNWDSLNAGEACCETLSVDGTVGVIECNHLWAGGNGIHSRAFRATCRTKAAMEAHARGASGVRAVVQVQEVPAGLDSKSIKA